MHKTELIKNTFRGRQEVVPRLWVSRDGKRNGYSPLCRNEWKKGVCVKLQKQRCRDCNNADYVPLSNGLILSHLQGNHILGVYPLLLNNTCHFITSDFDNHNGDQNPLEDIKAFYEVCQVQEISCYVLRSKSGNGYHGFIFFNTAVPAYKARIVAFALLQEAGVIGEDVKLSSFDRLFPNQDELSGRGLGNLIALPFQGRATKKGHTLFLDPETGFTKPHKDQWEILGNITRVPESTLDELIEAWGLTQDTIYNNNTIGLGNNETEELVLNCSFVKHCKQHGKTLAEPLWYALISNLVCVRPGGYSLCHELSRGYPNYSQSETDAKIHQAMDASGPHTCAYIRQNGFKCRRKCDVKSPAGLFYVLSEYEKSINQTGDNHEEKEGIKFDFVK